MPWYKANERICQTIRAALEDIYKHLRIDCTGKNIQDSVSGFLTRKASGQDGSHVGVIIPAFDKDSTNGVHNDDGVGTLVSGVKDEVVTAMPKSQVLISKC